MKFLVTVTAEAECAWIYPGPVADIVREALRVELAKKKHAETIEVSVRRVGRLEAAIWNLAQEIEETAADAANERAS